MSFGKISSFFTGWLFYLNYNLKDLANQQLIKLDATLRGANKKSKPFFGELNRHCNVPLFLPFLVELPGHSDGRSYSSSNWPDAEEIWPTDKPWFTKVSPLLLDLLGTLWVHQCTNYQCSYQFLGALSFKANPWNLTCKKRETKNYLRKTLLVNFTCNCFIGLVPGPVQKLNYLDLSGKKFKAHKMI